jgi:hypothetical protein
MKPKYSSDVECVIRKTFDVLSERERRCYAAAEAVKLGHGGVRYLATVLGCDEKTIRRGVRELDQLVQLPPGRSRKKGGAGNAV